jgi:hypothetical protein
MATIRVNASSADQAMTQRIPLNSIKSLPSTYMPKQTGRRVQIYIPADLVKKWDALPRYERSAEVAKALRAHWKIEANVAGNVAQEKSPKAPPHSEAEK